MRTSILTGVAAGAMLVGAVGATLAGPGSAEAADPTPTPAATTTPTTPAITPTPAVGATDPATDATTTPRGFSGGEHGPGLDTDDLAAAAKAIGITEAALKAELEAGKTAAQVAEAKGVDVQDVIDAVVAYDKADIAAAVQAGTLTQAQADARLGNLTQHVTDEVNGVASGRGGFGHGHGHGMSTSDIADAAKVLGMTEAELTAELEAGTSTADVAEAKGVDIQEVIDAMVAADTAEIEAAVKAGTMTQAQADERLANLEQHVTDEVNATGLGRDGHGGRGHHGGFPGSSGTDGATDGTAPAASPTTGTGTGTGA